MKTIAGWRDEHELYLLHIACRCGGGVGDGTGSAGVPSRCGAAMNAKERRHVARLETKIKLLEEARKTDMEVYRKFLWELVDVKTALNSWRDAARELLEQQP